MLFRHKSTKVIKKLMLFIVTNFIVTIAFSIPMIYYGPLKNIRELLVTSAMTTYKHQYIVTWFLSKEEINKIMDNNLVNDYANSRINEIQVTTNVTDDQLGNKHKEGLNIIDIKEKNFKGKLLVIDDPKRILLGVTDNLNKYGMKLDDMVAHYGAIAGINAGGFSDAEGQGNGGVPTGLVMKDGDILYNEGNQEYSIVGLNNEGVLILGKYNIEQLKQLGVKDAVSFTPFLVVNGEPVIKSGNGGQGIAPRTAIGQKKDGTILLLTVDGRQVSSIGATLKDIQDILISHGAYNAANLDGGSSTTMVWDGKIVNNPSSKDGVRFIPTAFLVK